MPSMGSLMSKVPKKSKDETEFNAKLKEVLENPSKLCCKGCLGNTECQGVLPGVEVTSERLRS